MPEPTVVHNTFVLERSYSVPPERVFSALSEANQKRRWYMEGENKDLDEFTMDFRVGGTELGRYRYQHGTPFPGAVFTSEAIYRDIVPNRRVVATNTMTIGDKRISAALVTFELLPTDKGTDLIFTHQAAFFEGADGPQIREMGWRKLLDRLGSELERA
jgi:uncharacterized protein YndB with AHSA1/START domain